MNTSVSHPADATGDSEDPAALAALVQRWQRRGLWAIGVWALLLGAWLTWAPISGAVVGYGAVKVESDRLAVTHRDGGIVAQVLVREGQSVTQGQALVVLEDARVDASVDLLQAQLDSERLRRARLHAEAAVATQWSVTGDALVKKAALRAPEALARERAAFEARRRSFEGQLASVRSQLKDTEGEVAAHQRNREALTAAIRLAQEEVTSAQALQRDNFVARARVLSLERALAEYESRGQTIEADQAQARQRGAELQGRLLNLRLAYVQAATDDLRETSARLTDLEARLRAGVDTAVRQRIVAPVAGRLVGLRVNTVGSAVGPREPIVDIVPSDVPLRIEVRLAADAVSEVRPGQMVDIRIPGHSYRYVGTLHGKVLNVSPDALSDARSGSSYFTVLVELLPDALARLQGMPITPGMAAEVFIVTSERSVLQFLLDPLTAGLRRAFREQ
ncbi:MAG: HlyD family type I secretion periplasmic adaptor subunit [Rubrivivax sp.]|nr:HlyD family type I secretion periplasmic adaptor subunit [Rubrivivax sp.]